MSNDQHRVLDKLVGLGLVEHDRGSYRVLANME